MTLALEDTIVALATPPGIGGLAVLRLSGPRSWEVALGLSGLRHAEANAAHVARVYALSQPPL